MPRSSEPLPDPGPELIGRHDIQVPALRLRYERIVGWQLLHDVPGLPTRQPLGQRLQRGLQGAVCRLATDAARRLPDHRDDLLVLHPSSPRNAVSLTAETGVRCMFPRRYSSCMRM